MANVITQLRQDNQSESQKVILGKPMARVSFIMINYNYHIKAMNNRLNCKHDVFYIIIKRKSSVRTLVNREI